MDAPLRALNRFGLGARVGERREVGDPQAWLEAQLDGPPPALPPGEGTVREPADVLEELREARAAGDPDAARRARRRVVEAATAEAAATLTHRVVSDRPFVERLVAFWSNHLCVSGAGKLPVATLAGAYEREAVRPHVLGRFENMLQASARHPAMLLYLDNAQSVGPGSRGGRRPGRRGAPRGLNENYARELLELHTVGVDGGYTQEDVQELARALTGWTVARAGGPGARRAAMMDGTAAGEGGFAFVPALHEPGARTVLGRRYAEGGAEQAEAILRDLARHPATARFLAGKLVRHFVDDAPPPDAVEAVAGTFRETGGDLREVGRAVARLDAAWDPASRKLRAPQDWLVAVLRAFRIEEAPAVLPGLLRQLRQPLWAPPAPTGYGDTAGEWSDPDALMNRAELARTLAARVAARGRPDPRLLLDVVDVEAGDPLVTLLSDETIARDERVALALAGPAFQWR